MRTNDNTDQTDRAQKRSFLLAMAGGKLNYIVFNWQLGPFSTWLNYVQCSSPCWKESWLEFVPQPVKRTLRELRFNGGMWPPLADTTGFYFSWTVRFFPYIQCYRWFTNNTPLDPSQPGDYVTLRYDTAYIHLKSALNKLYDNEKKTEKTMLGNLFS